MVSFGVPRGTVPVQFPSGLTQAMPKNTCLVERLDRTHRTQTGLTGPRHVLWVLWVLLVLFRRSQELEGAWRCT